ncbi:putative peptide zinc metalloprotease protein [Catenulispora sp. GAS73]|uniref:hypothetical protein n=1 Tax=Catenulispora sp. GAS73 TaxID=3156269 RepID=UPI0035133E9B
MTVEEAVEETVEPGPALGSGSRLSLHPLASRRDGEDWIVGRSDTGDFVALPDVAVTLIDALRQGRTVGEAKQAADAAHGSDVDALDFCRSLIELGFVAGVDGIELDGGEPRAPSLRRLRAGHVRWLVSAPAWLTVLVVTVAGFCYAAASHALPGPADFFVVHDQGVNLLLIAAIGMSMVALHEFCHLAAARAADVDAWLGWGTRLAFLVAQTAVPGLWMAPRRARVKVYAAGIACDLLIAGCAAAGAGAAGPASPAGRVLEAVSVNGVVSVLLQFELYMRTDVYFVVQDLLGCKRLFDDATAYLGYVAARRLRRAGSAGREDPRLSIPAAERRSVTCYAWFVLVGSTVTLSLFACYGIPVVFHVYALSMRELADGLGGGHPLTALDGACALLATAPLNLILLRALLRRHGPRLRTVFRRVVSDPAARP